MTENRRIALNTLATYGRSPFTLACSLFTSRWIRMALGHSAYGLFGSQCLSFVGDMRIKA